MADMQEKNIKLVVVGDGVSRRFGGLFFLFLRMFFSSF